MVEEFPSNSNSKPRPRRTEIVATDATLEEQNEKEVTTVPVTGKVIRRKKTLGRRLKETFFGSDTNSVMGYLFTEVIVPAFQEIVVDVVKQGIEKAVYRDDRPVPRSSRRPTSSANRTSIIHRDYNEPSRRPTSRSVSRSRSSMEIEEIILDNKMEAIRVLEDLDERLNHYDAVSVADLYDLVREPTTPVDHRFGWTELDGAQVVRVKNGWLIDMPRPVDIR